MKRIAILTILFLAAHVAMAQYCGQRQDFVQNGLGQALPNISVAYYLQPSLTPATVYSSTSCGVANTSAVTCLSGTCSNPQTTNGLGLATAYLAPGLYTITYTGTQIQTQTFTDQNISGPGTTSCGSYPFNLACGGTGASTALGSAANIVQLVTWVAVTEPPYNAVGDCTLSSTSGCTDNYIGLQAAYTYCHLKGCSLYYPPNPYSPDYILNSISSASGGTIGTSGTCTLALANGATATATLPNSNWSGATFLVTAPGSFITAPTTATATGGTSGCSGTITIVSSISQSTLYYSSQTINPLGVSFFGPPRSSQAGGSFIQPVGIVGAPGKDTFAPGDPSLVGYVKPNPRFHAGDISIYVNDSVDASSSGTNSFPNRLPGRTVFDASTAVSGGACVVTSLHSQFQQGDVGQAILVYGAGSPSGNLSSSIASVQSVSQATLAASTCSVVSGAQVYTSVANLSVTQTLGNAAWAYDDSGTLGGYDQFGATQEDFSDLYIGTTSGTSNQNNSVGFFFQGPANSYLGVWQRDSIKTEFGFVFAPMNENTTGSSTAPAGIADFNHFEDLWIVGSYPWISYGGNDNNIGPWQLTMNPPTSGLPAMGPQILNGWGGEEFANHWKIDIQEEEINGFGCLTGTEAYRIAGAVPLVSQLEVAPCATGTSALFEIDSNGGIFQSIYYGNNATTNFGGNQNNVTAVSYPSNLPLPTVSAGAVGNTFCELYATNFFALVPSSACQAGGVNNTSVGPAALARYRIALNRTHDFIDSGGTNYYFNKEDLWIWPGTGSHTGIVPVVTDSSSPIGESMLLASGTSTKYVLGGTSTNWMISGTTAATAGQIPAGEDRIYFFGWASAGGTSFKLDADYGTIGTNPTSSLSCGGSSGGETFTLGTTPALYYCDIAVSSALAGDGFGISLNSNSATLAADVHIDWLGVKPWNTDLLTTNLTLGGGSGHNVILTSDSSGNFDANENGSGASQVCTQANGKCAGSAPTYYYFPAGAAANLTTDSSAPAQNTTKLYPFYWMGNGTISVSSIELKVGTSDNSSNQYDIGRYGPGCFNSTANVPLLYHTGPIAGSSINSGGTGPAVLAISGAPVTVSGLPPGWYCDAVTTSGASPTLVLDGDNNGYFTPFANNAVPLSGTGTTTGATLNSTITAPAISWLATTRLWIASY